MPEPEGWERRYLDATTDAVGKLAARFQSEPASFLSERDLQALLFAYLFDGLQGAELTWPAAAMGLAGIGPGSLRANPVKTEYLYDDVPGTSERFDVAVLSPRPREEMYAWTQHVAVGIEIKFWQADGSGWGLDGDMQKLERYAAYAEKAGIPFTGLSLLFCHRYFDDIRWLVERRELKVCRPSGLSLLGRQVVRWAFMP